MKQLTIISGKGGTGKTTITASFAILADNPVIADADVDAPDLHLILAPKPFETIPYVGMKVAVKDHTLCKLCAECRKHCRFDAIDEELNIIEDLCEGCGVCAHVCPNDAISLKPTPAGYAYMSETRAGPMSHAVLKPGASTSGKLVTLVRENARKLARRYNRGLIIIDGPPGIGCPVIAAIVGVDLVLIVTEPSVTAIHDMERILEVVTHFRIPALVCINKYDLNPSMTREIEHYCKARNVKVAGKLPFDKTATRAMVAGKSVVEFNDSLLAQQLRALWKHIDMGLKNGYDDLL